MKKILQSNLGFGSAPLGNMYRDIPEDEAIATVNTAWDSGIRYFDTAPIYGAGLSESRLGEALSTKNRDEYILSTKVGRIVSNEIDDSSSRNIEEKGGIFKHGRKNKIINDYSADATLQSIEDSLKRLKTDHIDFVFIHDLAQDLYGDEWISQFEIARTGAFRALTRLRDEGVIKGWGLGVNRTEAIELMLDLDEPKPDVSLLAGRYTLLDHERALQSVMPAAQQQGMDIIVGGPYSSGVLVGGKTFEYQEASPEILDRVAKIKSITDNYHISIKAVALQFSLANPAVAAVIPGASKPSRIAEDNEALNTKIPASFWKEMREHNLVSQHAPLPIDFKS
ncbi:D-threo-aldose 1-dehydrogenase [Staphylococcus casei]|uniref:aldo/keto reductase n=1 Tax=Staphylococcus casei TaxID=201828 RepID=UPI000CD27A74|nr:aldo/keto reductase [Staphylococcus casei]PNZ62751.1 D-threo-aldose 1-dehydrogenase [Staphylococcus casei]WJE86384.1 aldo/keto reductase [Staphylococcus casei]